MSADRWSLCPICRANQLNILKAIRADVEKAYGVVGADEYMKLRADIERKEAEFLNPSNDDYSVREDYSIILECPADTGGETHRLSISYHARCERAKCRFELRYDHVEPFDPAPPSIPSDPSLINSPYNPQIAENKQKKFPSQPTFTLQS